jgi:altronate dehydratase large subunit
MEFSGYQRDDGRVGIRNLVLVCAVVECVEGIARKIAEQVKSAVAVTHHYSCLHLGNEQVVTIMVGIAENPNIAGVVLIGMGCEALRPEIFSERLSGSGKPLEILSCTEMGGAARTIDKGIEVARNMEDDNRTLEREPFPLDRLVVAVKCGGSDATSGLAANASLGVAVDHLIREGASVVFTEPIEAIGGEEELYRRAANEEVRTRIEKVISNEENYWKVPGARMEFMCKGNIDGGLSSIEEKSLGALHKTGSTPIVGVLENSAQKCERPTVSGVYFQDGTHLDVQAVTNLAAAGAQVLVFTTGVGAALEGLITPTIRVCGNPTSFAQMQADMDINAGTIIQGRESIEEVGSGILREIIEVSSGKRTKLEGFVPGVFDIYRSDPRLDSLAGISRRL